MPKNFIPKSWHKFQFLINPNEFENIFRGFRFVCTGIGTVLPEDYVETAPQILFENYASFYSRLISGQILKNKEKYTHELYPLIMGITNDLKKCRFKKIYFSNIEYAGKHLIDFQEPYVKLSIGTLRFDDNENIVSYDMDYIHNPETIIGMAIIYPNEITYIIEEDEEHEEIILEQNATCEKMETYTHVYEKLVKEIETISDELIFSKGGKLYETSVKISKSIYEKIDNTYFMRKNKCKIK